jgi:hypothetical protein
VTREPLTDDDLARMEHRARRFQGAYTGTSGTLAADVMRLLGERLRLLEELARVRGAEPPRPASVADDEYLDSLR